MAAAEVTSLIGRVPVRAAEHWLKAAQADATRSIERLRYQGAAVPDQVDPLNETVRVTAYLLEICQNIRLYGNHVGAKAIVPGAVKTGNLFQDEN